MALAIGHGQEASLLSLSDEILVHIFSYLSASAGNLLILSCCHSRLQRLCHDRRVVGDLNFGGDFRVTEAGLKRFLKKNLPVRKLSLSSCYWLNPTQVCNSISGLPGLTSLKMVELRLSASNISSIINSLPNLGDLALTFSTKTIAKVVENLESELGRHEAAFWARLKSLSIALIPSPDDPSTLYTLTHLLATTSSLRSLKIYTANLLEEVSVNSARFNVRSDFRRVRLENLDSLVLVLHDATLPYLLVRELLLCLVLPNCNRDKMSLYWVSLAPQFSDLNPNPIHPKGFQNISTHKAVYDRELTLSIENNSSLLVDLREISFALRSRIDDVATIQYYIQDAKALKVLEIQGQKLEENSAKDCPTSSAWLAEPSLDLSKLTRLAVPPCLLLDKIGVSENNPIGHRTAHSSRVLFSAKSFIQLSKSAPCLTHIDVNCCASINKVANACSRGGDTILQALANFSRLKVLRITGLALDFSSPVFSNIFSGCPSLSELHCNTLSCDVQKLGRHLVSSLKMAKNLTILRVQQRQLSPWLEQLLVELVNCPQLQQLILVDLSEARLPGAMMPQKRLKEVVEILSNLSFVHITSPLFTAATLKKTLSDMRGIKKSVRKHLVFSMHLPSKLHPLNWDQVAHIPGRFLDSLLSFGPERMTVCSQYHLPSPIVGFSYQELFMDHSVSV